jgi:hypothetical protein
MILLTAKSNFYDPLLTVKNNWWEQQFGGKNKVIKNCAE